VGDVGDRDAVGDHQLEDGFPEQVAGRPGGDRAEARHLAQLVALHPSSGEGVEIDAQEGEVGRIAGPLCPAPDAGVGWRGGHRTRGGLRPSGWRRGIVAAPPEVTVRQLDERVECVRLAGFAPSPTPRNVEELVDDRVQHGVHPRPGIGSSPRRQVPRALGVGPATQPSFRVNAPVGGVAVGVCGRPGTGAALAQLGQARTYGRAQQRALDVGLGRGRAGDLVGLGTRQLASAHG
jgi:hypothetical protein